MIRGNSVRFPGDTRRAHILSLHHRMSASLLRRWQTITASTLFVGYAGYYICRSNYSVSLPLLKDEFLGSGLGKEEFGSIATAGVLAYAFGKVVNGLLVDYLGGRRFFIFGMLASVACTVWFGLASGFTLFALAWVANRFVQSMGWVALVKTSSRWFPARRHASILGVLSMSYLLGDAFARFYLGFFLQAGFGWRGVFFVSAATLGGIALASRFLLKTSPQDVGAEEPSTSVINVFGEKGEQVKPANLRELLMPLLTSFAFWTVCVMNFGLTLLRETFNTWNPLFLAEAAGATNEQAAFYSGFFPLVGAVSALLAGYLSDSWGARHGRVVVPSLLMLIVTTYWLSRADVSGSPAYAAFLTSLVSFFLIAPYTFLSGVIALDLGGKLGSSTTAGLIDSAGYLGGALAGWGIAKIVEDYGWSQGFQTLMITAVITTVVAIAYWIHQEKMHRRLAGSLASPANPMEPKGV